MLRTKLVGTALACFAPAVAVGQEPVVPAGRWVDERALDESSQGVVRVPIPPGLVERVLVAAELRDVRGEGDLRRWLSTVDVETIVAVLNTSADGERVFRALPSAPRLAGATSVEEVYDLEVGPSSVRPTEAGWSVSAVVRLTVWGAPFEATMELDLGLSDADPRLGFASAAVTWTGPTPAATGGADGDGPAGRRYRVQRPFSARSPSFREGDAEEELARLDALCRSDPHAGLIVESHVDRARWWPADAEGWLAPDAAAAEALARSRGQAVRDWLAEGLGPDHADRLEVEVRGWGVPLEADPVQGRVDLLIEDEP